MANNKQLAVANIKNLVENSYYQQQLKNALGANAGAFATSIMEVVTNDNALLQCEPGLLMQEAMKAASLKLPINKQLGYAYLVPFNDRKTNSVIPTLIIGYKGYIQLAIRTGQYRHINAGILYEGELQCVDKLSGMIDVTGERKSDKVVGYFAFFELLNGFKKSLFITLEGVAKYGIRYAPTLRNKKAEELMELAQKQSDAGVAGNGIGWIADFNSMACKTCLRQLLGKYGLLSAEMQQAYINEVDAEARAMGQRDEQNNEDKQTVNLEDADATEVKDEKANEATPVEQTEQPMPSPI